MISGNWNMRKIVLYLTATACIGIGTGAFILFSTGLGPLLQGKSESAYGSTSYTVNEEKTSAIAGIEEIVVDASNANVTLSAENRSDIKANLKGEITTNDKNNKPKLEVYKEGNTLYIKEEKQSFISIGVNINNSNIALNVALPSSYGNNIKVTSSYGDVTMNTFKLKDLNCSLRSGTLEMGDISARSVKCNNSYGDVKLKNFKTEGLDCELNSGKLEMEKILSSIQGGSSKVKCVNSYGDVILKDVEFGELNCKLSSGNLNMNNITVKSLNCVDNYGDIIGEKITTQSTVTENSSGKTELNAFSGDLKTKAKYGDAEIEYANFNNSVDIKSSSGQVKLGLPKESNFSLEAKASSGKITCDFPITVTGKAKEDSIKDSLAGTVGKGGNKINIEASYGDVDIKS